MSFLYTPRQSFILSIQYTPHQRVETEYPEVGPRLQAVKLSMLHCEFILPSIRKLKQLTVRTYLWAY